MCPVLSSYLLSVGPCKKAGHVRRMRYIRLPKKVLYEQGRGRGVVNRPREHLEHVLLCDTQRWGRVMFRLHVPIAVHHHR